MGEYEQGKETAEKLYDRALHYLGYRPRSEKELREYLEKLVKRTAAAGRFTGWEEAETIEKIIRRLQEAGFLNDHEFTLWWIGQRQESTKPKGKRLVAQELWQKGIEQKFFENCWQEYQSAQPEDKQAELIKKLIQRKLASLPKNLSQLQKKKKVSDYLARRGFEWPDIQEELSYRTVL